jgi:hypothetical protein
MKMKLKALPVLLFLVMAVGCLPALGQTQMPARKNSPTIHTKRLPQTLFAAPEEAVAGLVSAMRSNNRKLMHDILGGEADRYIQSKDSALDDAARTKFLAAYDETSRIEAKGHALAILHVGKDEWPLPFPLVKQGGKWHFDTQTGIQEWQDRRIGANELSAIQISLAYVDAQREYVLKDRNQDGLLDYAQHIVSSDGLHDGLYWPKVEGKPVSPMGPVFATASKAAHGANKLESKPYHGYFFRILTAQGKSAPGGMLDYMVKGKLIGGFALIGYPAHYGESGIKTFIVNHDGKVYSKDLGPQTELVAEAVSLYDPDASWQREVQ